MGINGSFHIPWLSLIPPTFSLTTTPKHFSLCRFCSAGTSCWRIFGMRSICTFEKKDRRSIAVTLPYRLMIWFQLLFSSCWNRWTIVCFVNCRNLSSSLPVHFALIDSFTPCELSCSVLGYAYGIMETAMTWIMKNGKQLYVCSDKLLNRVVW